jgi:hypothetical protein
MSGQEDAGGKGEADPISGLLRAAGARPEIDPMTAERVERNVRMAWQVGVARRRRRRLLFAAMAASMVSGLGWLLRPSPAPEPVDVATLIHSTGLTQRLDHSGATTLGPGMRIAVGQRVATAPSASAQLSIARLDSLRLDRDSEIQFNSAEDFVLHRGAVYLDSGRARGGVTVRTPLLVVRDVGTRFLVRRDPDGHVMVAVRDGAVDVAGELGTRLRAGEKLRVDGDGAEQRGILTPWAAEWNWARAAMAPFDPKGRTLREMIAWYAHEAGLTLDSAVDPSLDRRLDATVSGDFAGLDAEELLDLARVMGPMRIEIDRRQGRLHVLP